MDDLTKFGYESDAEEAARMGGIFRSSEVSARIVALETVHAIKASLDEIPRWRLVKRWRWTRTAKALIKEHELAG